VSFSNTLKRTREKKEGGRLKLRNYEGERKGGKEKTGK